MLSYSVYDYPPRDVSTTPTYLGDKRLMWSYHTRLNARATISDRFKRGKPLDMDGRSAFATTLSPSTAGHGTSPDSVVRLPVYRGRGRSSRARRADRPPDIMMQLPAFRTRTANDTETIVLTNLSSVGAASDTKVDDALASQGSVSVVEPGCVHTYCGSWVGSDSD